MTLETGKIYLVEDNTGFCPHIYRIQVEISTILCYLVKNLETNISTWFYKADLEGGKLPIRFKIIEAL